MAQVPRNDGFSVAPSERAAFQGTQFVDPGIKFSTPDFSDAAERLDKAQTKVFDEIDTARTTAQITEFKKYAADRQREFLNLRGEQALLPDKDGRSLIDREDENLRKMAEKLKGKLTPRQQRMFDKEAGAVFTSQYVTASHHVGQENYTFKVGSQTGKRDLALQLAAAGYNDDNTIAQSHKDIVASEQELGRIQGLSSAQVKANTQKSLSTMYRGSIEASLLEAIGDPEKAGRADLLLKTYSQYMLPADVAACRKLVDGHLDVVAANRTEQMVTAADTYTEIGSPDYRSNAVVTGKAPTEAEYRKSATRAFYGGFVNGVSGGRHKADDGSVAVNKTGYEEDKTGWRYGASVLSVPKAMAAAKRLGIDFNEREFHDNEGYNLMLGNAYYGDMIVAFAGDEDKAAAAYYGSEEAVKKAEEAAAKEGDAGNWLAHMDKNTQAAVTNIRASIQKSRQFELRDEKGNKIKGDSVQYIDAKMGSMWITRAEMRERILQVDERARRDPKWLEDRLNGSMQIIENQKTDYRQKQLNNMIEAKAALFAAGGRFNQIPPQVLAKLDVNQQEALQELAKKIAADDQSTDDEVFYRIFGNDRLLKAMPKEEFMNLQGTVSGQKWEMLKKRYFDLQNEGTAAQDLLAANRRAAEAGQIVGDYNKLSLSEVRTEIKNAMGPDAWDKLDEDEQELMVGRIRYKLALEGQASGNNLHGQPAAIGDHVRTILADQAYVGGLVYGGKRKPVASLSIDDFKNRGDTDAHNILTEIGRRWVAHRQGPHLMSKRSPTESEINEAIRELFMSKNLQFNISGLKLSEPLVKHVTDTYRKQKGHEPSSGDVLRMYLLFCASGDKLPYKLASYGDLGMPVEDTSDDIFADILTPPTAEVNDDYYHGFKVGSYK